MARIARRLLVTSELNETIRVYRSGSGGDPPPCPHCRTRSDSVAFDEAAAIAPRGALWLAQTICDGSLHSFEDRSQKLWICSATLIAAIARDSSPAPDDNDEEIEARQPGLLLP